MSNARADLDDRLFSCFVWEENSKIICGKKEDFM